MAGIIVNPRARIFHGHDWIYATEVRKVFGNPAPGAVVTLKDFKDRPLGVAIYNPGSRIVARRFSRRKQDLDLDFFRRRLERAANYRASLPIDPKLMRLVWSESDGLPGVIVDRYGDCLVLQTLTLAMDQRKDLLVQALNEVFKPQAIVERNDNAMRPAEGLPLVNGLLQGEIPEQIEVAANGLRLQVDLLAGQKTGLYLDQLENHALVARLAEGRRVLDVFSHAGGFALACRRAGAKEVLGIEISAEAVAAARANAERNELSIDFQEANAFDKLREWEKEGQRFDMVILDPPSFTRNKEKLNDALRGYKEIHLRALRLMEPGGILASFTCSHHLDQANFLEVIRAASVDAKRSLRRVAVYSQRADHPVIATIPETEYLRGFAFECIGAW